MKNKFIYTLCFIIMMQTALLPFYSFAQIKTDVITMVNGEKKTGKVISVNETVIKFSYEEETAAYDIKNLILVKSHFQAAGLKSLMKPLPQQPIQTRRLHRLRKL